MCSKNHLAMSNQIIFLGFYLKHQRHVLDALTEQSRQYGTRKPFFETRVNCNIKVKAAVRRGMTPCSVIDNYQRLGGNCCLSLLPRRWRHYVSPKAAIINQTERHDAIVLTAVRISTMKLFFLSVIITSWYPIFRQLQLSIIRHCEW